MTAADIKPDVITFNSLIAAAPDYATARDVLAEMTAADIKPDVVTFSSLIAAAPDYATARDVLAEMTAADVKPNDFTSTIFARFVESPDQATDLRVIFRKYRAAGNNFHRAVYAKLCRTLNAKELLDWAFSGGAGAPFAAFDTPLAIYRRQNKLSDALRIASAFPYLAACRMIFRQEVDKSLEYLYNRFETNEEPQNAAYALGVYYEEQGQISEAIKWLVVARDHPQTLEGKKVAIQKSIEVIEGRS
jgi:Pentatricopeptide repeat domain